MPRILNTEVPDTLVRIRDPDSLRVPGLPLVTIVSVVRNAEATLEHAIQSLRAQTYPSIEHVIIDGASRDGTQDIIQSHLDWVAAWSSQPDDGLYDAMNKGIASANGDIIGILNADDWFEPDFIEKSINTIVASTADFVFGNIWMHGYRGQDLYLAGDPEYAKVVRRDVPATWHPTMMCKRKMYEQLGLYRTDMKVASDYDFQIRAFNAGFMGVYAQEAVAHVAAGGVSTTAQHTALREGFLCSVWNGYPVWKALPHWTHRWIATDYPSVNHRIHSFKCRVKILREKMAGYSKRAWDTLGPLKPYIPGKKIGMKILGIPPAAPLTDNAIHTDGAMNPIPADNELQGAHGHAQEHTE
ncbi:MAG: glycosyltransferase family 2 protein [Phycisphaerales bacterium]